MFFTSNRSWLLTIHLNWIDQQYVAISTFLCGKPTVFLLWLFLSVLSAVISVAMCFLYLTVPIKVVAVEVMGARPVGHSCILCFFCFGVGRVSFIFYFWLCWFVVLIKIFCNRLSLLWFTTMIIAWTNFPFCSSPLFVLPPPPPFLPIHLSFPPLCFHPFSVHLWYWSTTLHLIFLLSFCACPLLSCLWQPPLRSLLQQRQRPLRAPAS